MKEKSESLSIEDFTKWRNGITDKYSFTRKMPMTWGELAEWGKEQEEKKQAGMQMINPDFK